MLRCKKIVKSARTVGLLTQKRTGNHAVYSGTDVEIALTLFKHRDGHHTDKNDFSKNMSGVNKTLHS